MKKRISFTLCILIVLSCFSAVSVQASASYVIDGVPGNGSYFEEHLTGTGSTWASTTNTAYFLEGSYGRNMNGSNTGYAMWKTNVPEPGLYKVEYVHVRITLNHEVVIRHNNQEDIINIPSGGGTCVWMDLGTFYFDGSDTEAIVAQRTQPGTGANLRVDAVRLTKIGGAISFADGTGSVQDGKTQLSFSINNGTGAPAPMTMMIGFYKENTLSDVIVEQVTLQEGIKTYSFESQQSNTDRIQVMLWDAQMQMIPITKPYILGVEDGNILPVVYAADFGAVGDGITDDGPALARAFSSIENGGILKLAPNKQYFIDCKSGTPSYFILDHYKNAYIDGQGSTLLFTRGNTPFLLQNCENVTFQNLKLDYNEATYFQGQVIAKNIASGSIDVLLENGYIAAPVGTGSKVSGGGGLHGMIFETDTKDRRITGGVLDHFKASQIEECAPDTFRFTFSESYLDQLNGIQIGDTITYGLGKNIPSPAGDSGKLASGSILVTRSSQIAFKNISLYRSLIMGFIIYDNIGDIYLDGVRIERKPGTSAMLSTSSDGIHAKNNRAGIHITGSYIEACGDDLISISTKDEQIRNKINDTTFTLQSTEISYYFYDICIGDTLLFVNRSTGQIYGTASVTDVTENASARTHQVVIDQPIPGVSDQSQWDNIYVMNLSACSQGTNISNNTLVPVFRHAMLLRLNDSSVSGNIIHAKGGAIGIRVQDEGTTGPFSDRVTIQDNIISNTTLSGMALGKTVGTAAQNIVADGNEIYPISGYGIQFQFANQITLLHNTIDMSDVSGNTNAVWALHSSDVDLGNLLIIDNRSNRPAWLNQSRSSLITNNVTIQP